MYSKSRVLSFIAIPAIIMTTGFNANAVEPGWQKLIDEPFHMEEKAYNNVYNCQKIDPDCDGSEVVQTLGKCGSENVTKEFYCAGPWRSYAGLWGIGGAYLFLSKYGANMPHVSPKERKGWAVWQWKVDTSGIYDVEIHYRPTENRTPDANYVVLSLRDLGEMDGQKVLLEKTIDQRPHHGPLNKQGWVKLGSVEYKKGSVAALGLWAIDDEFSDEADAVRWTLVEKTPDIQGQGANLLLLDAGVIK